MARRKLLPALRELKRSVPTLFVARLQARNTIAGVQRPLTEHTDAQQKAPAQLPGPLNARHARRTQLLPNNASGVAMDPFSADAATTRGEAR